MKDKASNEEDLCAMTCSIEELLKRSDEIALEAAKKIWGMDGTNEAARTYAMCRVIEKLVQHIGHSLHTEVVKQDFIRAARKSGIEVTSMPEDEWLELQLAKLEEKDHHPLIIRHQRTGKWWRINRDGGETPPVGPFDTKEEAEADLDIYGEDEE